MAESPHVPAAIVPDGLSGQATQYLALVKAAPRFHLPEGLDAGAAGREFALPDVVAHHALRVLRLAIGAAITLFTGAGGEFAATLVRADKRTAWVRVDAFDPVEREAPLAVTLVQGVAANEAMDYIVRKSVELGVACIQPVVTTRGARFPAGERGDKRLAHWRQIVVAACEQCGRNRVPPVQPVLDVDDWLTARVANEGGFLLSPGASDSLSAMTAPLTRVDLLVGPEGGWTPQEVAQAQRAGCAPVRLGPRVLRTETAAAAALSTINALWGDFR